MSGRRSVLLLAGLGAAALLSRPSDFARADQEGCRLRSATAGEIAWHDRILAAFRAAASPAPKSWRIQKESAGVPDYGDSGGKPRVCAGWEKAYHPAMPALKRVYVSSRSQTSSAAGSERETGQKMADLGKRLGEALRLRDYAQVSAIQKQMQALQNHSQNQAGKAGRFTASLRLTGNDDTVPLEGAVPVHIPGAAFAFRAKDSGSLFLQTRNGPLLMTVDRLVILLGRWNGNQSPLADAFVNGKLVRDKHWSHENIYNISVIIKGNESAIGQLLKGLNLAKLNALISK
ncbi:MAG: hypothetical protein ACYCPQ_07675 [Elusimicrobiota bacterium]